MKKSISITELKQIFQFLEQKRVRHYDLQVEMADHLATAIEVQWEADPAISLKEALEKEYANFGLSGFGKLVEKKQNEVAKHLFKQLHRQISTWMNSPKIMPLLAFIVVWAQLLQYPALTEYLLIGMMAIGLLVLVFGAVVQRRFQKKNPKKFLFLEAQVVLAFTGMNAFFLPVHFINIMQFEFTGISFALAHGLAIASAYYLLFCYELVFIQFKQKREEAEQLLSINAL